MNRYDLVIFDLDGTLLDTSAGILAALKRILPEFSLPIPADEKLRSYIGPPVEYTLQAHYALKEEECRKVSARFREVYFGDQLFNANPFPEIEELLKACKQRGVKLAVATNKREYYTLKLLDALGLKDYFEKIRGTDEMGRLKKTDLIRACVLETGVAPERSLMVGDAWSDEEGAEEAGVDFAAAMYGFGFAHVPPKKYVFLAESPLSLLSCIEGE